MLLQPAAPFSKRVSGAGRWRIRRTEAGRPFYCAVLEGECRLAADGHDEIVLREGDFVLIPSAQNFTMSSRMPARAMDIARTPIALPDGRQRRHVLEALVERRQAHRRGLRQPLQGYAHSVFRPRDRNGGGEAACVTGG